LIHDRYQKSDRHKSVLKDINMKAIEHFWTKSNNEQEFIKIATSLYREAFKVCVPRMVPYLENGKEWAKEVFKTLTSENFLTFWAKQIADQSYDKISQQMQEWYILVSILDPTNMDLAQDLMCTLFCVVVHVFISKARWIDELKPFLTPTFVAMLEAKPAFTNPSAQRDAKAAISALHDLISFFDNIDEFSSMFANALSIWRRACPNDYLVDAQGVAPFFEQVVKSSQKSTEWKEKFQHKWKQFLEMQGLRWLSAGLYGAVGTFTRYFLVGDEHVSLLELSKEINFGLLMSTGYGVEKLVATTLYNWFRFSLFRVEVFARSLKTLFTKEGLVVDAWAVNMFGKKEAELLTKGLCRATVCIGIATRCADPQLFLNLGQVVGIDVAGLPWVGLIPVYLVGGGYLVPILRDIWRQIHHVEPSIPVVQEFVNSSLRSAGFVKNN